MISQPSIDPSILLDAVCDDRQTAIDLLNMFFELTRMEMERLTASITDGDAATASAAAHKIAGSSVSCGLNHLAAGLREIETLCKEAIPADIDDRLQLIDRQLGEGRQFFENHLECQLI